MMFVLPWAFCFLEDFPGVFYVCCFVPLVLRYPIGTKN